AISSLEFLADENLDAVAFLLHDPRTCGSSCGLEPVGPNGLEPARQTKGRLLGHSGPGSQLTIRDDFAPGSGDQGGRDSEGHARLQEMHRPVREYGIGAARVKAVDLVVVVAVEGTRPRLGHAVGRRALYLDYAPPADPGTAGQHLVRASMPREPLPRLAGVFGEQDRMGGTVRDVGLACHVIQGQNAAVVTDLVD